MSDEIPEDIAATAHRIVEAAMRTCAGQLLRRDIEAALLSERIRAQSEERERAAVTGYVKAVEHCSARDAWQIAHAVGQGVAAAIRQGK